MLDLAEIQAAYYMVAASGVLVAALYYIQNMRAAERNRKTQLCTTVTEKYNTEEFMKKWFEVMRYDWGNVDEFLKKYHSAIAPDLTARRNEVWFAFDYMGSLLLRVLVDEDLVFDAQGYGQVIQWARFKPVIEHFRKTEFGPRYLENFEYLARRMWEVGNSRGYVSPGFRDGLVFDRLRDVYEPRVAAS